MLLNQKDLLNQLKEDNQEIIQTVENHFNDKDAALLNKKPTEKKWSVLECIEHLNKSHSIYSRQFSEHLGEKKQDKDQPEFLKPTWIGKYLYKSMKPKDGVIRAKMATMGKMKPDTELGKVSELDKDKVLNHFLEMQREIQKCLEHAEDRHLQKIKIQTEIPLLKMRLGDAIRFIMAHTQRHILQAERALEAAKKA